MIKFARSLLLLLAPLAVSKDADPLSGKWTVTSSIAGNESKLDCTFTQTKSDLTGSCAGEQGAVKITGKVDGSKVSWSYASDYNGTALTITYKGKLDAGKITGETTVDPFGVSGEFTATPVK
jgi:hypothetical protein